MSMYRSPNGVASRLQGGGGVCQGTISTGIISPGGNFATFLNGEILLPSAGHLKEGRGTTILELLRRENCISKLCPRPLGSHPTPTPK